MVLLYPRYTYNFMYIIVWVSCIVDNKLMYTHSIKQSVNFGLRVFHDVYVMGKYYAYFSVAFIIVY